MTSLLSTLATEVGVFDGAGASSLLGLLEGSQSFLDGLRDAEKALEKDPSSDPFPTLEAATNGWHKASINCLKSYNTLVNRFLKNILNNPRYSVELDEAYPFPINLHNSPVRVETPETPLLALQHENHTELLKAIILHLLKIGQCDIVKDLVKEVDADIDELLLSKFKVLNEVVDDITVRHDLTRVLAWFQEHHLNETTPGNYAEIEFKFCVLQFVLLLNGNRAQQGFTLESAVAAYVYSKDNFPRFFKDYVHEISPIMTLLLFLSDEDAYTAKGARSLLTDFSDRMQQTFVAYRDRKTSHKSESQFVGDILASFKDIHANHLLFVNLSNEFIAEYCRDLRLLSDLSLFQSVLLGFVNLPSFHKYSNLQRKLSRVSRVSVTALDPMGETGTVSTRLEAPFNHDLPFQLPDSNRFLFKYHPIFICPVSKEQLIPLTPDTDPNEHRSKRTKKLTSSEVQLPSFVSNPVVVLQHCRHVALQDSVWQLLKRGTENFKCHYCYKKHKISEVTDAYFIDL